MVLQLIPREMELLLSNSESTKGKSVISPFQDPENSLRSQVLRLKLKITTAMFKFQWLPKKPALSLQKDLQKLWEHE